MRRVLARKARNFLRRPALVQIAFIPTWLLLGVAKALIFIVPFRHLAAGLGEHVGVAAWVPSVTAREEARALWIGRLIRLAARFTPWDSNCFPQAVVARWLLGLRGIPCAIYFGVMRAQDGSDLEAHAWVASGRIPVTGGASVGRFTVVSVFVSGRRPDRSRA